MTEVQHEIVSFRDEKLILVDANDNEVGSMSKADCHSGDGVLHRAFSVFLFNDQGELLLQQRSESKRLWPLFWSNSCCSHPRYGESMELATERRLAQELNTNTTLELIYKFSYQASFGELGSENEYCWVFVGRANADARANETEIASLRFISIDDLQQEFEATPDKFTPWFKMEWHRLQGEFAEQLRPYTAGS